MTDDPLIGKTLAERYQVLELLGRGGMASVYKARHLLMNTTVALKVMDWHIEPRSLERFRREAKALARLNHPGIVKFIALESDGGAAFMVMEYLEGTSLHDFVQKIGPLSVDQFRATFGQVCDALAHAHDEGVLHRDIKSANILISPDGATARVLDFGIARFLDISQKLTSTGGIIGTANYMSPEQCSGSAVDERSDIYSLGCVMHEALTGKQPHVGDSSWDTLLRQLNEPLPPIDDPNLQMLAGVISKATEKDPALRYANMREFGEAVRTGELYQTSAHINLRRRKRRNADVRIVSLCGAFALTIIGLVLWNSGVLQMPLKKQPVAEAAVTSMRKSDALAILARVHKGQLTEDERIGLSYYARRTSDYALVSEIFQHAGNNVLAFQYFEHALKSDQPNTEQELLHIANRVTNESLERSEPYWLALNERYPESAYFMQLTEVLGKLGKWKEAQSCAMNAVAAIGKNRTIPERLRGKLVVKAQDACKVAKEHLQGLPAK